MNTRIHLSGLVLLAALAASGCGSPGTDARTDGDDSCTSFDIARLCVRGTPGMTGEDITDTAPVGFQIEPEGCHSSACTIQRMAFCSVTVNGTNLALDGDFCLGFEGPCTLPDCSGGGFTTCDSGQILSAGAYTVSHGTLSVSFTVPSTVPFGGECAP